MTTLDRARPSRQAQVDRACSDTTRLAPGDKRVVNTALEIQLTEFFGEVLHP